MTWSDGLNDRQIAAISDEGPAALVAGPGTGKTRTLLRKALQLIEDELATAEALRIVNFTRAGIVDLRSKLQSDPAYASIPSSCASTFHSLALRVLFSVSAKSIPNPLVMLDDWEERTFVDQLAKLKLELPSIKHAPRLREDYNSRWCIASDDATDWYSEGDRRRYETVYQLARDILGFATRGELTFLWWRYLRSNPGRTHLQLGFPWTHLLVDEYQDLNECEHEILEMLGKSGVSVFAVGDPNQSIYETMRHAHPDFCWSFPARMGGSDVRILNQTYRCPAAVLRVAGALMGTAEGVPEYKLATHEGEAHILAFPSNSAESSGVARIAAELIRRDPASRVLIAVPSRSMARQFLSQLDSELVVDLTREDPVDADACRLANALLRVVKKPNDSVAAATALILNCARTTRAFHTAELLGVCEAKGLRVCGLLPDNVSLPSLLGKARDQVRSALDELQNSNDLVGTLKTLTGWELSPGDVQLAESEVVELLESDQLEPGKITVMTLFACKGTESEWVIIPAVEPGVFERDLVGAPKEERRRLLYVGLTRAKSGAFLTYSAVRWGPDRFRDPTTSSPLKGASVFVDETCDRLRVSPESGTKFIGDFLG